jgi:hypothetical protein
MKQFFSLHQSGVFQKGMYLRKKALSILGRSKMIDMSTIIRTSYSGNEKTISLDPIQARKEYVENIINTDYTLCVKGDGNFSIRFYEVLSLGRIPLLVDTDCVLPLEEIIAYNQCMMKVGYNELSTIDQRLAQFHNTLTNEQFQMMQKKAREVFEMYLRLDKFFAHTLTHKFLSSYVGTY